ncbi:MAG: lysophospholipid acyltransferase family protein [Desulfobacteraceae bacterium]|nr:lysophospholipid acyltransferase family protein [Desulfobacteraceae bacterium]
MTIIFKLIGLIPRNFAKRLGNIIGHLWFLADRKHRNIAVDNLAQAFEHEKDAYEIRMMARQVFENIGQILFEICWSLHIDRKDFNKHFYIRGLSNYRDAYEKNRGVLVLTAHMGNWELLSIIAAMAGYPLNVVFRPLDFEPMNQFVMKLRTRFGAKLIPTAHSMRKILKALKQGEVITVLLDQNVDWYNGVFVDFFGRRACTNEGLALLALKTGAPVVPVFLVREGDRFMAEFCPEIPLIKTGDKTKDVEQNTQQYNRAIEAFVRQYPDQWFWVHQRWKTKSYHPWPRRSEK